MRGARAATPPAPSTRRSGRCGSGAGARRRAGSPPAPGRCPGRRRRTRRHPVAAALARGATSATPGHRRTAPRWGASRQRGSRRARDTPLRSGSQRVGIHLLVSTRDVVALASAFLRLGPPRGPLVVGPQEGVPERRGTVVRKGSRRAVEEARTLVGVVAAVGGDDRRPEVVARLEPA